MSWFKVDDHLTFHPKVIAVGNEAIGAWARLGAYCGAHLTDGALPAAIVIAVCGVDLAERLVSARFLEKTPEGNYQIHDYLEYNPSRADVEKDREATKNRQSRFREKQTNSGLWAQVNTRDGGVCRYCRSDAGISLDHLLPVARGGKDSFDNLVMACKICNSKKKDKTPEEAGLKLLDPPLLTSDKRVSNLAPDPTRPDPTRKEQELFPATPGNQVLDFEAVYSLYPRKEGRKKGMQRCRSQITTREKYDALVRAVKNYAAHADPNYYKHFDTFMGCWEDYIEAGRLTPRGKPTVAAKGTFTTDEDATSKV